MLNVLDLNRIDLATEEDRRYEIDRVDNMGLLLENHGMSVFQLDLPNDKIDGLSDGTLWEAQTVL